MNRKGIGFLAVIIFFGSLIGGGFIANYALEEVIGLGLVDIYNILTGLSTTSEDVPSLEEVESQLVPSTYNQLSLQKGNLSAMFSSLGVNVDDLNNNPEITEIFNLAFGSNYKVYMYSLTEVANVTFKVFEWSIQLSNGNVTIFQAGKTFSDYDVIVQVDHTVAYDLFKGSGDPEQAIQWIKEEKIKIKPITFIMGFANALPQIIELMQRHVQIV